jgi:PEP-CTERM motif
MKTQIRIASLALLTILCLMLAVAPAMAQQTLYDNGPSNGTTNAWTINFGYSVSDSAKVANISRSNVKNNNIVYWDPSRTDVLTGVDTQFGTTPFGSDLYSGTSSSVTNTFLGTNQYGYNLFEATYAINGGVDLSPGTSFYVTLSNACTTSGCSVSTPISWDENSGIGCTSPGCPSTAYASGIGSIPSEAFTLTGQAGGTTPEPSSIMLFGSGVLGLAGVLRRRLMG